MSETPLEIEVLTSRGRQTLKVSTVTAIPSSPSIAKDELPRIRSAPHNPLQRFLQKK